MRKSPSTKLSPSERFWPKVDRDNAGCWTWTAAITNGYGVFGHEGSRTIRAHVWAWQETHGVAKPRGMDLDHLCRNTQCVRPDHLELVTPAENRRRAAAARTHCPAGHPYSGENLYQRQHPKGYIERRCRQCRREGMRGRG